MEETFNDVSFLLNDKNILRLYKYKYILSLILSVLFFVITVYFLYYHYHFIVSFFHFFDKSKTIEKIVEDKLKTELKLQDFTTFLVLVFIYFYFFRYIEKKGIMADVDEAKEGKYFSFLLYFLRIFNFILFIPLLLYLSCLKNSWIEFFCILASYIIGRFVFLSLLQSYGTLICNYYSLDKWYRINKAHKLKLLSFNKQAKLSLQFVRDIRNDSNKFILNDINTSIKRFDKLTFNEVFTAIKWFVTLDIKSEMKYIFVLSILTIVIGIIAEFNLISIIYLFLNFILWYSILSIFLHMPKKAKSITLTTGKKINYVYVVEESKNGYILTLDSQNKLTKIMSSLIETIE
ncbi:hypothetical protein [Methanosarcina sp.]|uniref:hypothetical protein n=1 Tax=Methanosarcina sp. TaxID=2213 RepID=UPI003BB5055B